MTPVVVVASAPARCEVCQGDGVLALTLVSDPLRVVTPCLHCIGGPVPVVHLPFRTETPRRAS